MRWFLIQIIPNIFGHRLGPTININQLWSLMCCLIPDLIPDQPILILSACLRLVTPVTAEHLPQRQQVVGECEAARLGRSNWNVSSFTEINKMFFFLKKMLCYITYIRIYIYIYVYSIYIYICQYVKYFGAWTEFDQTQRPSEIWSIAWLAWLSTYNLSAWLCIQFVKLRLPYFHVQWIWIGHAFNDAECPGVLVNIPRK